MFIKKSVTLMLVMFACVLAFSAQTAKRPLKIDDLLAIKDVRDPQVSPDGNWVAYVLSTTDAKADKSSTDIWMVSFDGKITRRVTFSLDNESSPRWSPDGKFLSFTSSRPGPNKGGQIWLLDLAGGEAKQLTDLKGGLQEYAWSPDSKRIALVIGDPDPDADEGEGGKPKTAKPIVIDRYKFKQDREGYLRGNLKSYVYLFDIAAKKTERLTKGKFNESSPVWSPDGSKIAFTSNHQKDPDRDPTSQIFVADSTANSIEKQITPNTSRGSRSGHEWSPDGKIIAFVEAEEIQFDAYNMDHLTLVASDGSSAPTRFKPTEDLDRGVGDIVFTADGKSMYFTVVDNRSVYPAKADLSGRKSYAID